MFYIVSDILHGSRPASKSAFSTGRNGYHLSDRQHVRVGAIRKSGENLHRKTLRPTGVSGRGQKCD